MRGASWNGFRKARPLRRKERTEPERAHLPFPTENENPLQYFPQHTYIK